jgi:hypothetical protein
MARSNRKRRRHAKRLGKKVDAPNDKYTDDTRPDWSKKCEICHATPIVPVTGMCGPCTFGESETVDGNW